MTQGRTVKYLSTDLNQEEPMKSQNELEKVGEDHILNKEEIFKVSTQVDLNFFNCTNLNYLDTMEMRPNNSKL
jgi:hypothetical protein